MSKYDKLWRYLNNCGKNEITLSFANIEQIGGALVDHSFLRYKKELNEYGYKVCKISKKEQRITFEREVKKGTLVLYIHGKGGAASEAEHYKALFGDCDVFGFDYRAKTPWEAKDEFPVIFEAVADGYDCIILIANSIGAYFAMCALSQKKIEKAYFISPIVDMEKLICCMMSWENISENELEEKGNIKTAFGETLSWEYLCYVRQFQSSWRVPTDILYGGNDNLTSLETISTFAKANQAKLTIMEDGEHWFHTPEQMAFLDDWLKNVYKMV